MKRFLLATVASAVLFSATSASAADLAPRPYTKAPPPMVASIYDWTGFYIGASGGYGWGRTRWQFALTPGVNTNHNADGGFAGGQVGYNWQSGAWVFGFEGDAHWADIEGSTLCPNPAFVCGTDVRTLATIRGRIGYAAGPVLFYGTGGGAYADTRYSALIGGVPGGATSGFYNTDRWGYAAGAGIEWGFAPNWSAKVEYMHYGFDGVTSPAGTVGGGTADINTRLDTVKVGVNYRWGGPVARY